jgi:hypothetical protein
MANVISSRDGSSLADVVELILDKGIVIDAWAEVGLLGIPILSIRAKVVIASVDTYLRYADALGLGAVARTAPTVTTARWLPPPGSAPGALPPGRPVPEHVDVADKPGPTPVSVESHKE